MPSLLVPEEVQVLQARPAEAEARVRRWQRAGLAVFLIGGVPLLMGQAEPGQPGRVVEAERFVLRDPRGKIWAELRVEEGGPCLTLFDHPRDRRARLAMHADGTLTLSLVDKEAKSRVVFSIPPEGDPSFGTDAKRQPAAAATAPIPSVTRNEERASQGAILFPRFCSRCHGSDGKATRSRASTPEIPDFTNPRWQASRTDAQLVTAILKGKGTGMPAFDQKVSSDQARELVAFVRTFGTSAARSMESGAGDFDHRWRELQRQWEELDRQSKELSRVRQKP